MTAAEREAQDRAWQKKHPNVVEVYVGYLRKKLGRETVRTVRGAGYRLETPS